MKGLNDEKQMRSDWWITPLATGAERLKDENGHKAHSTQKPEALLYRVILAASNPGDVVLDPFFGSGTTGVAAKRLHREWIGIEREEKYIRLAQERIETVEPAAFDAAAFEVRSRKKRVPRVAFSVLLENGYLQPGEKLYFQKERDRSALIKPDARLRTVDGFEGSIHQAARHYTNGAPCNGWDLWFLEDNGGWISLDVLRERFRGNSD
jgi:modification methylase